MGKILGIISIKGGVGKTTLTSNLGAALAEFGKKILIVDANITAPNLGYHVGLSKPKTTLHHVLSEEADIGEAVYEYSENLHMIPGSAIGRPVNPLRLKAKIQKLRDYYDFILLDSSPNLNEEMLGTMLASDELLVVTSTDYPTLAMTLHAVKVARERKTPITGLIMNRVRGKNFELSIEDVEKAAKVPVIGYVPEDLSVPRALAEVSPAVVMYGNSDASVEVKKIAASIMGEKYKDTRVKSKIKKMFTREVRKDELNQALLAEGKLY